MYPWIGAVSLLAALVTNEMHVDRFSSFYLTKQGEMIMDSKTYTAGIRDFLKFEQDFILRAMADYDTLFEVGCARGERAESVIQINKSFYGIDINREYIKTANESFKKRNLVNRAEVSLFSVSDLNGSNFPLSKNKRTLILFPFNLLGNLQDFHLIFTNLIDMGHDFCFSTYKIVNSVQKSRLSYYENCGCRQIRYSTTPIGDLFDSEDGLHSAAFRIGYVVELLTSLFENKNKGATFIVHDLGNIGYLIHVSQIKCY